MDRQPLPSSTFKIKELYVCLQQKQFKEYNQDLIISV